MKQGGLENLRPGFQGKFAPLAACRAVLLPGSQSFMEKTHPEQAAEVSVHSQGGRKAGTSPGCWDGRLPELVLHKALIKSDQEPSQDPHITCTAPAVVLSWGPPLCCGVELGLEGVPL